MVIYVRFFVSFHLEMTLLFMHMCNRSSVGPLGRKQDAYITGNLSSAMLFNSHHFINRQDHPRAQGNQVAGRQCARGMRDKQVVSIPDVQLSRDLAGSICRHKYSCDTS